MKKLVQRCSITTFTLIVIGVTFCSGSPNAQPSPEITDDGENLSNADLHHLLSLLDDNEPAVISNDNEPPVNPTFLLDDLEVNANDLNGAASITHEATAVPAVTTTEVIKIFPEFPAKVLIKRPRPTTTTTEGTTTTTSSTTETPQPVSTTATSTGTGSDPEISSELSKRADTNVDSLKEIAQPSQQDLINQLSLFNSLLKSLGDNNTSSVAGVGQQSASVALQAQEEVPPTPDLNDLLNSLGQPQNASEIVPGSPEAPKPNDPAATLQSLALLSSLFGGANAQANPGAAAALLGLGLPGSNVATRQTEGKGQSDAEAAAMLTELLKQTGALGNGNAGNPNLQNFQNTNANMDATSSNQVAGLLSLLGTLGSLNQPQQQSNPLFNFGQQTNAAQPQQQSNFLNSLLGSQQQTPAQANSLSSLFGAASQPQGQAFNLGNIFAAQQTPSIPGLGLLSTAGTLGSTLLSTMSNFLGGSSFGGKPRVRGKGVDTRLGLGYRFGDAADAQIVWDVGPQLFTDQIRNEFRTPSMKSRTGQAEPNQHVVNTHARAEKLQQQAAAAKRLLHVQMQSGMANQQLKNRRLQMYLNQQPKVETTRKPLSLLDMWNAGKPVNNPQPQTRNPQTSIPQQLLMPPMMWNRQDTFQMLRRKSFMKRSSPQDKKPFYSDPSDDLLADHSTLTAYEKMLLKHGKDYGNIDGDGEAESKHGGVWSNPQDENGDAEEEKPRRRSRPPSRSKNPFRFNPFKKLAGGGRRPLPQRSKRPNGSRERPHASRERPHTSRERPHTRSERPHTSRERPHTRSERPHASRERPESREQLNERPQRYRGSSDDPFARDDNVDAVRQESEIYSDDRHHNSEREASRERSRERPSRPQRRKPNHNRMREDHFDHDVEGSEIDETEPKKPSSPLFGFANLFKRLVNPNPQKRKPSRRPADERTKQTNRFQDFRDTRDDMEMSESNDHFYARNSARQLEEKPKRPNNSFAKKASDSPPKDGEKSNLSHSTKDAIRMSKTNMPTVEGNPEADDSFLRRNAVVMNPALMQAEKKKIFQMRQAPRPRPPQNMYAAHLSQSKMNSTRRKDSVDEEEEEMSTHYASPSLSTTVLSYIKSFLNKKSRNNGTSHSGGLTSLRGVLPDSSQLNPLKILPARRQKPPHGHHRTKLQLVNGKPKIVNSTVEEEPIVHIGEDMPFEELTALFTQNSTKPKARRKKVKSTASADSRKDGNLDVTFVEKKEVATSADKDEEDEEYDDDDGQGIFIDIDSGEVNVMKPVAELTSFEPKKDSSEEYDEYEDTDGDGIADADMKKKQDIFDQIQTELKKNYDKMKKAHERAEAKKRRKEELVSKGMDESVDVVSKYFDMVEDTDDKDKTRNKKTKTRL